MWVGVVARTGRKRGTGVEASDRRPIAARNLGVTQRMAAALVVRGASPNGISIAGMVAEDGLSGRLGGEEFAVYLPGATLPKAQPTATRLLDVVRRLRIEAPGGEVIGLTVSIGAAGTGPLIRSKGGRMRKAGWQRAVPIFLLEPHVKLRKRLDTGGWGPAGGAHFPSRRLRLSPFPTSASAARPFRAKLD